MLVKHKYKGRNEFIDTFISMGASDYVKDGVLHEDNVPQTVMVESSADLDSLTEYTPTSIAYTAGFTSMWQMDADGVWQAIYEGE